MACDLVPEPARMQEPDRTGICFQRSRGGTSLAPPHAGHMILATALRLRTLRTFLRPFLAFLTFFAIVTPPHSFCGLLAPALGITPKLPSSSNSLLDVTLRSGYLLPAGHSLSPPSLGFATPLGETFLKPLLNVGLGSLLLHLPQCSSAHPSLHLDIHRLVQLPEDFLPRNLVL